jgi:hypothetical protein
MAEVNVFFYHFSCLNRFIFTFVVCILGVEKITNDIVLKEIISSILSLIIKQSVNYEKSICVFIRVNFVGFVQQSIK